MAITPNDVRLYKSERMTDFSDGGGMMAPSVIVDNQDNNVFTDFDDFDRLTGRVNLRKIFGAVLSQNNDVFLNAHALLSEVPSDPAADALIFKYGGYTTELASVVAGLQPTDFQNLAVTPYIATAFAATVTIAGGSATGTLSTTASPPVVGNLLLLRQLGTGPNAGAIYVRKVTAQTPGQTPITFDAAIPGSGSESYAMTRVERSSSYSTRFYGAGVSAAGAAANATSIAIESLLARVIPKAGNTYPTTGLPAWLFNPGTFSALDGMVEVFREGDPVLIHHTGSLAPQTVANAQTVNVGRVALSRLRVIGNNGVEIALFSRGSAAPVGVGCSADLDAGTVTFSNVAGMAQPVTIEHRIEEMALVVSMSHGSGALGLSRELSRAYPAGTVVSSLLMLGDLQGRVAGGFAQTAWTGEWADAAVGGSPVADFDDVNNPIVTSNEGAVTERWAVQFTNSTSFRVFGERVGAVGTGTTGGNFSPLNPATGAPFFTIPAAGWGSLWSQGNVWRFNTYGAQAPLWELRSLNPSTPAGTDRVVSEFRGYVNT